MFGLFKSFAIGLVSYLALFSSVISDNNTVDAASFKKIKSINLVNNPSKVNIATFYDQGKFIRNDINHVFVDSEYNIRSEKTCFNIDLEVDDNLQPLVVYSNEFFNKIKDVNSMNFNLTKFVICHRRNMLDYSTYNVNKNKPEELNEVKLSKESEQIEEGYTFYSPINSPLGYLDPNTFINVNEVLADYTTTKINYLSVNDPSLDEYNSTLNYVSIQTNKTCNYGVCSTVIYTDNDYCSEYSRTCTVVPIILSETLEVDDTNPTYNMNALSLKKTQMCNEKACVSFTQLDICKNDKNATGYCSNFIYTNSLVFSEVKEPQIVSKKVLNVKSGVECKTLTYYSLYSVNENNNFFEVNDTGIINYNIDPNINSNVNSANSEKTYSCTGYNLTTSEICYSDQIKGQFCIVNTTKDFSPKSFYKTFGKIVNVENVTICKPRSSSNSDKNVTDLVKSASNVLFNSLGNIVVEFVSSTKYLCETFSKTTIQTCRYLPVTTKSDTYNAINNTFTQTSETFYSNVCRNTTSNGIALYSFEVNIPYVIPSPKYCIKQVCWKYINGKRTPVCDCVNDSKSLSCDQTLKSVYKNNQQTFTCEC